VKSENHGFLTNPAWPGKEAFAWTGFFRQSRNAKSCNQLARILDYDITPEQNFKFGV
jgi:hypothetical protein